MNTRWHTSHPTILDDGPVFYVIGVWELGPTNKHHIVESTLFVDCGGGDGMTLISDIFGTAPCPANWIMI